MASHHWRCRPSGGEDGTIWAGIPTGGDDLILFRVEMKPTKGLVPASSVPKDSVHKVSVTDTVNRPSPWQVSDFGE